MSITSLPVSVPSNQQWYRKDFFLQFWWAIFQPSNSPNSKFLPRVANFSQPVSPCACGKVVIRCRGAFHHSRGSLKSGKQTFCFQHRMALTEREHYRRTAVAGSFNCDYTISIKHWRGMAQIWRALIDFYFSRPAALSASSFFRGWKWNFQCERKQAFPSGKCIFSSFHICLCKNLHWEITAASFLAWLQQQKSYFASRISTPKAKCTTVCNFSACTQIRKVKLFHVARCLPPRHLPPLNKHCMPLQPSGVMSSTVCTLGKITENATRSTPLPPPEISPSRIRRWLQICCNFRYLYKLHSFYIARKKKHAPVKSVSVNFPMSFRWVWQVQQKFRGGKRAGNYYKTS